MTANRWMGSLFGRRLVAGTMAAILCFLTGPALSAEGIDPDADDVLKSMSTYLANLSSSATHYRKAVHALVGYPLSTEPES